VRGRWYFVVTALSGTFAVTFSIVFAYVADITTKEDRSAAYGLVSNDILLSLCILMFWSFTVMILFIALKHLYSQTYVLLVAKSVNNEPFYSYCMGQFLSASTQNLELLRILFLHSCPYVLRDSKYQIYTATTTTTTTPV